MPGTLGDFNWMKPLKIGWWFGTYFPYIGNNHPSWLIFVRGVGQPPTRKILKIIHEFYSFVSRLCEWDQRPAVTPHSSSRNSEKNPFRNHIRSLAPGLVHTWSLFQNWLVVWNMFYFPYMGNNHPNWLISFRGVATTNQIRRLSIYYPIKEYRLAPDRRRLPQDPVPMWVCCTYDPSNTENRWFHIKKK